MDMIGSQRRFFAEVRFGTDRSAVALPGGAALYDAWRALEPFFGELLLEPEWRPAEAGATWVWDQPSRKGGPRGAELSKLRRGLVEAADSADAAAARAQGSTAAALVRTAEIARSLARKGDGELALFLCPTPGGMRVHSWGAAQAAIPRSLDPPQQDILGKVVIAGSAGPLAGEIVLENSAGTAVDRTAPNPRGEFLFSGLKPGFYRVRAQLPGVTFTASEVAVELGPDEAEEIVFEGSRATSASTPAGPSIAGKLKPWLVGSLAALFLATLAIVMLRHGGTDAQNPKKNEIAPSPGVNRGGASVASTGNSSVGSIAPSAPHLSANGAPSIPPRRGGAPTAFNAKAANEPVFPKNLPPAHVQSGEAQATGIKGGGGAASTGPDASIGQDTASTGPNPKPHGGEGAPLASEKGASRRPGTKSLDGKGSPLASDKKASPHPWAPTHAPDHSPEHGVPSATADTAVATTQTPLPSPAKGASDRGERTLPSLPPNHFAPTPAPATGVPPAQVPSGGARAPRIEGGEGAASTGPESNPAGGEGPLLVSEKEASPHPWAPTHTTDHSPEHGMPSAAASQTPFPSPAKEASDPGERSPSSLAPNHPPNNLLKNSGTTSPASAANLPPTPVQSGDARATGIKGGEGAASTGLDTASTRPDTASARPDANPADGKGSPPISEKEAPPHPGAPTPAPDRPPEHGVPSAAADTSAAASQTLFPSPAKEASDRGERSLSSLAPNSPPNNLLNNSGTAAPTVSSLRWIVGPDAAFAVLLDANGRAIAKIAATTDGYSVRLVVTGDRVAAAELAADPPNRTAQAGSGNRK